MARYRNVHCLIWFDEKFVGLSDDAKLIWFFLLTNPRGTMLGIAVQGQSDMAEFLGWPMKRFREPFAELFAKQLIDYHEPTRTLYLRNFLKYNPIENENQAKSAAKLVDEIPENSPHLQEVKWFIERLAKPFLKPLLERLAERYAQPEAVAVAVSSSSKQDQEQEKERARERTALVRLAKDPTWLDTLRQNPAYQGLDVDKELGRCEAWCTAKGIRVVSKKRFVNWLNRAEERPHGPPSKASILDTWKPPEERERLAREGKSV